MAEPTCTAPACDRRVYARGHCERHYRQLLRSGQVRPELIQSPCAVPTCGRPAVTRGWCHGHYLRVHRTGDVRADVPLARPVRDTCGVQGCDRGAHSAGLCRAHARRLRLYGDPTAGGPTRRRSPRGGSLSHGYWAVPVPPTLRHLVAPGLTTELEHRLVMAVHLGRALAPEETVHHRNGDRLDNLELWSSAQPKGQRVVDKLAWARAIIAQYGAPAVRSDVCDCVAPKGFEPSLPP